MQDCAGITAICSLLTCFISMVTADNERGNRNLHGAHEMINTHGQAYIDASFWTNLPNKKRVTPKVHRQTHHGAAPPATTLQLGCLQETPLVRPHTAHTLSQRKHRDAQRIPLIFYTKIPQMPIFMSLFAPISLSIFSVKLARHILQNLIFGKP